ARAPRRPRRSIAESLEVAHARHVLRRPQGLSDWPPRTHTPRVSDVNPDGKLLAEEDRLWTELHGLIDGLRSDQVEQIGYFAEGWSADALVGHIWSWCL